MIKIIYLIDRGGLCYQLCTLEVESHVYGREFQATGRAINSVVPSRF